MSAARQMSPPQVLEMMDLDRGKDSTEGKDGNSISL